MEWNAENQLKRVLKNAVEQSRFGYDPVGRRVETIAGAVTQTYTHDGWRVLRANGGGTSRRYVLARLDEPLAEEIAGLTFLHTDGLQSLVATTDPVGAVLNQYSYSAYGVHSASDASGFGFTGRGRDEATGLYYYRARYYDTLIGRFISEDPIHFNGGVNFYAYVRNRPVSRVDPFGLADVKCTACGDKEPDVKDAYEKFCKLIQGPKCLMGLKQLGLDDCAKDLCEKGMEVTCNLPDDSNCGAAPLGNVVLLGPAFDDPNCAAPRPGFTLAHEIAHKCGIGCDAVHPFYCPYEQASKNRDAADNIGLVCSE
jgi:RHS repeat-associated protein